MRKSVTAKLISAFVFAKRIVQSLYFLNPKFQASRHIMWLYSPVCVGTGRKPRRPVFSERGSYIRWANKMFGGPKERHWFFGSFYYFPKDEEDRVHHFFKLVNKHGAEGYFRLWGSNKATNSFMRTRNHETTPENFRTENNKLLWWLPILEALVKRWSSRCSGGLNGREIVVCQHQHFILIF